MYIYIEGEREKEERWLSLELTGNRARVIHAAEG